MSQLISVLTLLEEVKHSHITFQVENTGFHIFSMHDPVTKTLSTRHVHYFDAFLVSSVSARLRHCRNPALQSEMAPRKMKKTANLALFFYKAEGLTQAQYFKSHPLLIQKRFLIQNNAKKQTKKDTCLINQSLVE